MGPFDADTTWSRRDALKTLIAAGLGVAVGKLGAASALALRRRIPSSGAELPVIGLGTYSTFDVGDDAVERAAVREVLRRFVDAGGSVVDSSPMYGSAEAVTGDIAADLTLRDRLFLATKVWTSGEAEGIRQMETSFKRLRTTLIDLMQVHNLLDWPTRLKTLRAWKEQGRVRYVGVTHYTAAAYDELARIMQSEPIDFVQFNYSIVERQAEARLLPLARQRGVAVLVNRPFAKSGLFSRVRGKELPAWAAEFDCASWAQFFLKYILAEPAVTCAIPATSRVEHLVDNLQAGVGRLPDAATRRRMVELIEQV